MEIKTYKKITNGDVRYDESSGLSAVSIIIETHTGMHDSIFMSAEKAKQIHTELGEVLDAIGKE